MNDHVWAFWVISLGKKYVFRIFIFSLYMKVGPRKLVVLSH